MYLFHTLLACEFLPTALRPGGVGSEEEASEEVMELPAMPPPVGSLAQGGIRARSFRHLVHWSARARCTWFLACMLLGGACAARGGGAK